MCLRRLRPRHQSRHHTEQTPDVVHKTVMPVGIVLVVRGGGHIIVSYVKMSAFCSLATFLL